MLKVIVGYRKIKEDNNGGVTSSHHREHTLEITSQVSDPFQVRLQSLAHINFPSPFR